MRAVLLCRAVLVLCHLSAGRRTTSPTLLQITPFGALLKFGDKPGRIVETLRVLVEAINDC